MRAFLMKIFEVFEALGILRVSGGSVIIAEVQRLEKVKKRMERGIEKVITENMDIAAQRETLQAMMFQNDKAKRQAENMVAGIDRWLGGAV